MQGAIVVNWAAEVAGRAFGYWLSGTPKVSCSCTHDVQLLNLLEGQLNRCGPEHLGQLPVQQGIGVGAVFALCALCFLLGAAVALLVRPLLGGGAGTLEDSAAAEVEDSSDGVIIAQPRDGPSGRPANGRLLRPGRQLVA